MTVRKIVLGLALMAAVGAGGYGAAVWWPKHQAQAAQVQADAILSHLRRIATDVQTGEPRYAGGAVTYAPVTFTVPPQDGQPQPVKATLGHLTVTPDGVANLADLRLTVTMPDGSLTLGLQDATLSAFEVKDGIPLHLAGQLRNPSLSGDGIEKLKRQRALLDMLLTNAPAAVQGIPDQVLTSLGSLTVSGDLRYDPAQQHLTYRSGYDLPGLLGVEMAFSAGAVSPEAMKSINLLSDPALKAQENPALSPLSKGAALSQIAQQGDLENFSLSLTDKGLVNSVVQVYSGVTQTPEAEARSKLVEIVSQYPVESLIDEPTPEVLQLLADARGALANVLRGDATRLAVTVTPRDREQLEAMKQKLTTLNDMAAALDIDVSARK